MSDENSFPVPVWIHPSRWMDAVAERRRTALTNGQIPHTFHYEGYRQSQLWKGVANCYAPDFSRLYHDLFSEVECAKNVHLLGLGTGGGEKERWLAETLISKGIKLRFTALDVSGSLAVMSTQHLAPILAIEPRSAVADLLQFSNFGEWCATYDNKIQRIVTAFGLTPNCLPSELIPYLFNLLRPDDLLLISANLSPSGGGIEAIRPGYDNQETRSWISQVLIDWGIREFLSEPAFRIGSIDGESALIADSEWLENREIPWENNEVFRAKKGEKLQVFYSIRFTPDSFQQSLTEVGFKVRDFVVSDCEEEGVAIVSRGD